MQPHSCLSRSAGFCSAWRIFRILRFFVIPVINSHFRNDPSRWRFPEIGVASNYPAIEMVMKFCMIFSWTIQLSGVSIYSRKAISGFSAHQKLHQNYLKTNFCGTLRFRLERSCRSLKTRTREWWWKGRALKLYMRQLGNSQEAFDLI